MALASPRGRRRAAVLLSAAALMASAASLVPTPAHAAVPSNDNFANAAVLSGGVSALGYANNTGATTESGEPVKTSYDHAVSATVWWRWTAPLTGGYAISTDGSTGPANSTDQHPTLDTTLSVFTGSSVSALTRVATDDDNGLSTFTSATGFAATAGTTYYIQVGMFSSSTPGTIRLTLGPADVTGTMTYDSVTTSPSKSGCLEFYTDNTFTTRVAAGCGSGEPGTTTDYSVGLVPAGTYFVRATSIGTSTVYYPGGTSPTTAAPFTVPGAGCTLTGVKVDFVANTFSAPTGRVCPFAPACQQATGAAAQAAAVAAAAKALPAPSTVPLTAHQAAAAKLKKQIKKAKKKHKPTAKLVAKLARVTQQIAVDNAAIGATNSANSSALSSANAALAAAQAKATATC